MRVDPVGAQFLRGGLGPVGADVGEPHGGLGVAEAAGDGQSQPSPGPGDQDRLACQRHQSRLIPCMAEVSG